MKKALVLLLALIMLVSAFAACTPPETPGNESKPAVDSKPSAPEETPDENNPEASSTEEVIGNLPDLDLGGSQYVILSRNDPWMVDEVSVEGTTYGLQQGTEYIPWAVCIDNNGKAIADFAMGESFTTKSDTVAECKVSVKGSFFAGDDGLAVVRSTATPDSKCAGFYNVIFQGDLTGAERQTLLNNLIRDPYFKNRKVVEFAKCAWGQPVSAVAVGFDSDGNFGEIAIEVFTPTK